MTEPTLALSVRQPWAFLIIRPDLTTEAEREVARVNGHIKDVENRQWRHAPALRGRIWIHAAKGMTLDEYADCQEFAFDSGVEIPGHAYLDRGGIIGSVELVDVLRPDQGGKVSSWYNYGCMGLVLRNPIPCEFRPRKGSGLPPTSDPGFHGNAAERAPNSLPVSYPASTPTPRHATGKPICTRVRTRQNRPGVRSFGIVLRVTGSQSSVEALPRVAVE